MLTEAERMERREAVESAIGTHRAEGIALDETVLSLMERFVNGEFTLRQFSAAMDSHAETVVSKDKQLAGAA